MACFSCEEQLKVVVRGVWAPLWVCVECGADIPDGFPVDTEEVENED